MKYSISGMIMLFIHMGFGYSQSSKVEHIIFGNTIDNPIKIEVLQSGNKYTFYAENRSYYPYSVELKIQNIQNLDPLWVNNTYKVIFGKNNLITLTVKDAGLPVSYDYSYKYRIGVPCKDVISDYPYLIPFNGKFEFLYQNESKSLIKKNAFVLGEGDTIYAMRKGLVVATPDMYYNQDRISKEKSLEVMHKDGTIMIYENLDPDVVFIKPGKMVYSGQPVGVLNSEKILEVLLVADMGDGRLKNLEIHFCVDKQRTLKFSEELKETSVSYPFEIISKEMSKREIKQLSKAQLYE
ncbi:MAG: hypothetical protein JXP36_10010 [Bacteroidales bacterium]|nr:hypothetical protein [Bacteroidales bacterium]MBN2819294.1 hypothetical protein [Bacteroidales bacterium]